MKRAFILGVDSAIARGLWQVLSARGIGLVGTTRRQRHVAENVSLFDLSCDSASSLNPDADVAFLCAAITSMEQCETDPIGTREVNVQRPVEIAKRLHESGTFVVFLSTSAVFCGADPFLQETARPHPANEYGRQKAEAESRIAALGGTAVVRLTKVLDACSAIVNGWRKDLLEERVIYPIEDILMAPISKRFAVGLLQSIGDNRCEGIFHASGMEDVSYADFAVLLAASLGSDGKLVVPVRSEEAGVKFTYRPKFAALGMGVTNARLSIGPQSPGELIAEIVQPY